MTQAMDGARGVDGRFGNRILHDAYSRTLGMVEPMTGGWRGIRIGGPDGDRFGDGPFPTEDATRAWVEARVAGRDAGGGER